MSTTLTETRPTRAVVRKRVPFRTPYLSAADFNVVAIDAPGHGGRPRTAHDEQEIAALQQARAAGEPVGPIVIRCAGMAGDP